MDESGATSFGVPIWIGFAETDGAYLKFIAGSWLLKGINQDLLSYKSRNDADNYPPIQVTKPWNSESKIEVDVTIQCSNTSVPTPAPTDQPSEAPVNSP